MTPALSVHHLGKTFRLYERPVDRLREALFGGCRHRLHYALREISFTLGSSEALAILGRNGAGKSTLLKLITGVLLPDEGHLVLGGRTTGLLELGTGFDPMLSGLENITINGTLLGMGLEEIKAAREDIIAFSELGDFIRAPVRTYSSGMVMRLGFSIAIHANPSCLIVDEALSVGDARFQQKCLKRIREFKQSGGALLFVSHDINAVKMICDRALVMEQGAIVFDGDPVEAAQYYYRLIAGLADDPVLPGEHLREYGHRRTRITAVELQDAAGHATSRLSGGSVATVRVGIFSEQSAHLNVGVLIRDRLGQDIFGTNTALLGLPQQFSAGEEAFCDFSMPVSLAPGKYTLTVAVHSDDTHVHDCQHWWDDALSFEVTGYGGHAFSGLVSLPVVFSRHAWPH